MRVVVLLIVLLGLAAQSCGSRKVEKHSKSSLEETKTSLQEQTKVTEIQFDRKKVFEIMRELNIRNGSITFNPDGSVTAKGDEIDLKNKEAGEELESTKVKEENAQLSFDQDEKKAEEDKGKKVDREQFGWWGILFFFIIIAFLTLIIN
ncbi:hypothetical protein [Myroides odoratus]|uniref:Uncharacterized protein n=1 Tax=Myroides odoratus TaxID=256 RepID=A0A378RSA9_MYROD|nr:hypothetical protein [Myroides odoratus]QQU04042.1 hypothetical protein I6I89_01735 [Myroides odoratus]STZ28570.1 Uncharacterised protein [Myroides odoratus]